MIFVFLLLIVAPSLNAGPDRYKWESLKCRRQGFFSPSDALIAEVYFCGDGQCSFVCQAGAFGLIYENGTTSAEIYDEWVHAVFPPIYRKMATVYFNNCYDQFGQYIDPSDPKCVMSKDFLNCVWGIMPDLKCRYHPR